MYLCTYRSHIVTSEQVRIYLSNIYLSSISLIFVYLSIYPIFIYIYTLYSLSIYLSIYFSMYLQVASVSDSITWKLVMGSQGVYLSIFLIIHLTIDLSICLCLDFESHLMDIYRINNKTKLNN
jgi:hypothetical protein